MIDTLVFGDIVAQGEKHILDVFGRHDDAALHLCLRHVGSDRHEVDKKLIGRMGDYNEISIMA